MLHADVFEREQERLVMEAAGRIAKAIMKELSENDQPPLLSLSGLAVPTAIAVPKEKGGFYYVRTDKATWAQAGPRRAARHPDRRRVPRADPRAGRPGPRGSVGRRAARR